MRPLLCIFALFFAGCLPHKTTHPPDQKRIAAMYADMLDGAVEARKARLDSAAAAAKVDSVLAAYGATRQEFLSALEWYNGDVERWKPFFEEVVNALEEKTRAGGGTH